MGILSIFYYWNIIISLGTVFDTYLSGKLKNIFWCILSAYITYIEKSLNFKVIIFYGILIFLVVIEKNVKITCNILLIQVIVDKFKNYKILI